MLQKQVSDLQQALAEVTKGMAAMAAGSWKTSAPAPVASLTPAAAAMPQPVVQPRLPFQISRRHHRPTPGTVDAVADEVQLGVLQKMIRVASADS